MQAYEHILSSMIIVSKQTRKSKKEILELLINFGAFFTYPDSVRGAVCKSTTKSFRQPSHFTDGAWMNFIIDRDTIKSNLKEGYPLDKLFIPKELKIKAADGLSQINEILKYNPTLLNKPEGKAIMIHLLEDHITDKLFQEYMATCYIDNDNYNDKPVIVYGVETSNGLAKFNQTNKIVSMETFRKAISLFQKLTTLELFKRVKLLFDEITFEDIKEAIYKSYDNIYPECMYNAKEYAVPKEEEQKTIINYLQNDEKEYYENIKKELIIIGAFNNEKEIIKKVKETIDDATDIIKLTEDLDDKIFDKINDII